MKVGIRGDGLVEIVDVGGVVFVVMQGHRLGIDVRFEGIGRIGERRQGKRPGRGWGSFGAGGGRGQAGGEHPSHKELEKRASFHGLIIPLGD